MFKILLFVSILTLKEFQILSKAKEIVMKREEELYIFKKLNPLLTENDFLNIKKIFFINNEKFYFKCKNSSIKINKLLYEIKSLSLKFYWLGCSCFHNFYGIDCSNILIPICKFDIKNENLDKCVKNNTKLKNCKIVNKKNKIIFNFKLNCKFNDKWYFPGIKNKFINEKWKINTKIYNKINYVSSIYIMNKNNNNINYSKQKVLENNFNKNYFYSYNDIIDYNSIDKYIDNNKLIFIFKLFYWGEEIKDLNTIFIADINNNIKYENIDTIINIICLLIFVLSIIMWILFKKLKIHKKKIN